MYLGVILVRMECLRLQYNSACKSVPCGCQMAVWYDRFWTSFHRFLSQFIPVQHTPHRGEIWILAEPLSRVTLRTSLQGIRKRATTRVHKYACSSHCIVSVWRDSMQSAVYSKSHQKQNVLGSSTTMFKVES